MEMIHEHHQDHQDHQHNQDNQDQGQYNHQDRTNQYIFWSWSNGSKIERSERKSRSRQNHTQPQTQTQTQILALEHEQYYDDNVVIPDGYQQREKYRENQNEKLSSRSMVIQKSINPFINSDNYIQHLDEQEQYLRPRNTDLET
jgi:hypothetical protein